MTVFVLLCGARSTLLDLVGLNLAQRGHRVRRSDLHAASSNGQGTVDAVVAEIGESSASWGAAARLRASFPGVPLILFGDAWQNYTRQADLQPCVYLRKPFAMGDLLAALRTAVSGVNKARVCATPT